MDWMFYLLVVLVLFSLFATMLTIRYLLTRRLEKQERKRRAEEVARQTAESNSGL
jgi:type II secretory pathway pseudopilin PulG